MGWLSKISTVNILGSQKIEPMILVDVNGCISQQLAHPEEILWLMGKMDGYSLPFHFIPIYTKGHPFTTSTKNDQFRATIWCNDTTYFSDNKYTAFPKFKRLLRYLFANLTLELQHFHTYCVGLTFANQQNNLFCESNFTKNRGTFSPWKVLRIK